MKFGHTTIKEKNILLANRFTKTRMKSYIQKIKYRARVIIKCSVKDIRDSFMSFRRLYFLTSITKKLINSKIYFTKCGILKLFIDCVFI